VLLIVHGGGNVKNTQASAHTCQCSCPLVSARPVVDIVAVRIIAGRARGRRLFAPKGQDTRPTPDRVREALFSILGARVRGATVLDLFAGTGALGLEALSRDASHATFAEKARTALVVLRRNIEAVGLGDVHVIAAPASRAMTQLAAEGRRFDLIFLDPPYALGVLSDTLAGLAEHGLFLPHATIVCEHHGRDAPPQPPPALRRSDTRVFGDVALSFFEECDRCTTQP
jgi:16S rRNA (guanine966-N2)-methyltransferase